jgi:hypothetical protein
MLHADAHLMKTLREFFFAAIHRKHENQYGLPLRYERYVAVWSASQPFGMLAVSKYPILFMNETAAGWTTNEMWDDVPEAVKEERGEWAGWTYTTTIAWAWRRNEKVGGESGEKGEEMEGKNVGFLDDEVILSVGVDDEGQVYGKLALWELLQCLRLCPLAEV